MNKTNVSITVDPEKWEVFKKKVGNASENLQNYMETVVDLDYSNNFNKVSEIQKQIQDLEEKENKLLQEKRNLMEKISTIRTKKKSLRSQKENEEENIEKLEVDQ